MKSFAKALFLFFILALISVKLSAQHRLDKVMDTMFRDDNLSASLKFLQGELKKTPNEEYILQWIGFIYLKYNTPDSSEKYYRTALSVNPRCMKCYVNLARVEIIRGNNAKTISLLDQAITVFPDSSELFLLRSEFKEYLGRTASAIIDLNTAVEKDPQNVKVHFARAAYRQRRGNYKEAIVDLFRAKALDPQNPKVYYELAGNYFYDGQYQSALSNIDKSVSLDTFTAGLHNSYLLKGNIYASLENVQEAEKAYAKAISLNPGFVDAYYWRAYLRHSIEDMKGMCVDLKEGIRIMGNDTTHPLYQRMKTQSLLFCDSAKPSFYYQQGIAHYNLGEFEEAVKSYSLGLKMFPNNSMLHSFRGNAYMAMRRYRQAIHDYNASLANIANVADEVKNDENYRAIEEQGHSFLNFFSSQNNLSLAEAYYKLNVNDSALICIDKAIKEVPHEKGIPVERYYLTRVIVLLELGKPADAGKDCESLLLMNPDFFQIHVYKAISRLSAEEMKIARLFATGGAITTSGDTTKPFSASAYKLGKSTPLTALKLAIQDCNNALEIYPDFAAAYYLRGLLKRAAAAAKSDWCFDLKQAKTLGFESLEANECK